jgi:acetyl esterase/lipase
VDLGVRGDRVHQRRRRPRRQGRGGLTRPKGIGARLEALLGYDLTEPGAAPVRQSYRPGPERWGELLLPAGDGRSAPVAVLLHGGFWRARYTLDLMRPLAADLARRGWAAWNLEYRRTGQPGGGWPGTAEDVGDGIDALTGLAEGHDLDLDRVVVIGHSAGGHLALWAAGRADARVRVRVAVTLAGVADLATGAREGIGSGAVREFLGAMPDEAPDRYAAASPIQRLPLPGAALLVHGEADDTVPVAQSRAYAEAAAAAGGRVTLIEPPGAGHTDVIDPAGAAWAATVQSLDELVPKDS